MPEKVEVSVPATRTIPKGGLPIADRDIGKAIRGRVRKDGPSPAGVATPKVPVSVGSAPPTKAQEIPAAPPESRPASSEVTEQREEVSREEPQQVVQPAPVESLTGEESDEELKSLGYGTDRSRNRVKRLLEERNTALSRADQIEQSFIQLQQEVAALRQNGNGHQAAAQAQEVLKLEMPPFPESGTVEEQEQWREEEKFLKRFKKQIIPYTQQLMSTLAPALRDVASSAEEREWSDLNKDISAFGYERGEIEPYVQKARQIPQYANIPLRGLVYQVIGELRRKDSRPAIPRTSTPGKGRTAPPAETKPAEQPNVRRTAHENFMGAMGQTDPRAKLNAFTQLFRSGVIRVKPPQET